MELINERRAHLAALLGAVAGGCEKAFAELHGLTRHYLYHVALRVLNSPPHAEEVLQEAYVTVWQQAHRFQPELGSAMTWLMTIVRNQSVSALRSQRLERHCVSLADDPHVLDDAQAQDGADADPIRQAFYANLRRRLPAALARLEPAQRQSICLTYHRGMAHAELSAHLDVPLGTVKSWLRRGMARLGDYLVEEEDAPPPRPRAAARPRQPMANKHALGRRC